MSSRTAQEAIWPSGPEAARLRHLLRDEVVYRGPRASQAFASARDIVLQFRIYDRSLVAADLPPAGVAKGLEFVQRIHLGLLPLKGPVRVLSVWDESTKTGREAGFAYLTLPGHPEFGVAAFSVALAGDQVRFRIESRSRPGRWFVRLGAPVGRRVQRHAYDQAFRRMHAALADLGPQSTPNLEERPGG